MASIKPFATHLIACASVAAVGCSPVSAPTASIPYASVPHTAAPATIASMPLQAGPAADPALLTQANALFQPIPDKALEPKDNPVTPEKSRWARCCISMAVYRPAA